MFGCYKLRSLMRDCRREVKMNHRKHICVYTLLYPMNFPALCTEEIPGKDQGNPGIPQGIPRGYPRGTCPGGTQGSTLGSLPGPSHHNRPRTFTRFQQLPQGCTRFTSFATVTLQPLNQQLQANYISKLYLETTAYSNREAKANNPKTRFLYAGGFG